MIRRVRKVPVSVGAVGLGSEAFLGLFFFSLFIGLKGFVFFCFVIFVFLGVGFSIIFHYFPLFFSIFPFPSSLPRLDCLSRCTWRPLSACCHMSNTSRVFPAICIYICLYPAIKQ